MHQIKKSIKRITPEKIWTKLFSIRRFVVRILRRDNLTRIKNNPFYYLATPYRTVTAKNRALPDFLIIGTQKGGTVSLHRLLAQHPQMHMAKVEAHYFDIESNYKKGELWYRSHFPFRSKIAPDDLVGERTPDYLFFPNAAKRIQKDLPNIKLICLLRNPTERAISNYFMAVRGGRESLPIMEALTTEEERYGSSGYGHRSYKRRGLYLEQLKRYEGYSLKNQLLILSSEEFFTNPQKTLKQVFRFLGVGETFECSNFSPRNVGKNKTPIPKEVYEYLNKYFKPYNRRLYNYLNRDFGW